jgi:hypothetical protein
MHEEHGLTATGQKIPVTISSRYALGFRELIEISANLALIS